MLAVQDAQYSGADNAPVLASITGTPAGSPVAPTTAGVAVLQRLPLAQVAIAANATTITSGNITDVRPRATAGHINSGQPRRTPASPPAQRWSRDGAGRRVLGTAAEDHRLANATSTVAADVIGTTLQGQPQVAAITFQHP